MSINVYKCPINTYKCHLLLNSQKPNTLEIGDSDINNSLLNYLNTKMNRLHEKCPRIVYNDKKNKF